MEIREAVLNSEKSAVRTFLAAYGLRYDDDIDYTVYIVENGSIIATASAYKDIIKAVAVSHKCRGENLVGRLISHLIIYFNRKSIYRYKLYTKPENRAVFENLNFREVASTDLVTLMESKNKGIRDVLSELKDKYQLPPVASAALVMNCNPFTEGHRYLIKTAAAHYPAVLVFIVEEDKSLFSFSERFILAQKGTEDLTNVYVLPSTEYLVSAFTFPDYFLKQTTPLTEEEAALDALIFKKYFVATFNIVKRYLGSETDPVTLKYNAALKNILGDMITVIPRLKVDGTAVSASLVRKFYEARDFPRIKRLVPKTTLEYLKNR